jgi:hypothetical protein
VATACSPLHQASCSTQGQERIGESKEIGQWGFREKIHLFWESYQRLSIPLYADSNGFLQAHRSLWPVCSILSSRDLASDMRVN